MPKLSGIKRYFKDMKLWSVALQLCSLLASCQKGDNITYQQMQAGNYANWNSEVIAKYGRYTNSDGGGYYIGLVLGFAFVCVARLKYQ